MAFFFKTNFFLSLIFFCAGVEEFEEVLCRGAVGPVCSGRLYKEIAGAVYDW